MMFNSNKINKPSFNSSSMIIYTFIFLWVFLAAFPFIWTFWGSFKVELDFFSIANWTNAITGENTKQTYGSPFTFVGYHGAWVQEEFWKAFINTSLVCLFVVRFSLCTYICSCVCVYGFMGGVFVCVCVYLSVHMSFRVWQYARRY